MTMSLTVINSVREGLSSLMLSFLVFPAVPSPHFVLYVTFLHIIFWIYEHTCSLLLVLDKLAQANAFFFPVQGNNLARAGGVECTRDLALDF